MYRPTGESVAWCWNWDPTDPQKNGFNIVIDSSESVGTPDPCIIDTGLDSPDMVFFNSDYVINVFHSSMDGMLQMNNSSAMLPYAAGYGIQSDGTIKFDGSYKNGPVICQSWQAVPGYSAFGSYTGNASTDGPFVYTGFKPAWIMYKSIGSSNWQIRDSTRNPYNPCDEALYPNLTGSTTNSGNDVDLLSNGFKT